MNSKSFVVLLAAGAALLATSARAQIDINISGDIRLGRTPPPPPPEVVVLENDQPPGPPPWAASRGFSFRSAREYYYYPAADVYYRPADHTWFYMDGGRWRVETRLPANIYVDFDRSVMLSLRTDRPYEFNEKVAAYYPRDYFVRRVRVKGGPVHYNNGRWDRDRDDHRRDNDHRDNDRRYDDRRDDHRDDDRRRDRDRDHDNR